VRCNVLQHVGGRRSVLQRVAVCVAVSHIVMCC